MDGGSPLCDSELADYVKACKRLALDLADLAGSLNTAPVTLAALAKECRLVTGVLSRFKVFYQSCSQAPVTIYDLLADICNGPLRDISLGISDLQLANARLKRNGADDNSQLTIVWNESALKQMLRHLSSNRSSMEFLLNCAIGQYEQVLAALQPKSPTTSISMTIIDSEGQCLSPTTLGPRSTIFRVSDLPGVRSALEELRPQPGIIYTPSAKLSCQLHSAIEIGDEAAVLELLLRRVDPNAPESGSTISPLHRAFDKKSSSIATFLAIAGASLNEQSSSGENALIRGIKCKFPDKFIALLCELGACIDDTDSSGFSALHHAASSVTVDDTLAVLIHAGADMNLKDHAGRTPLILAVEKARMRSVELLTEYEADLEVRVPAGGTALHIAIAKRHYMLAELLVDRGARIDSHVKGHTSLTLAISRGSCEIAAMLVEGGADVNLQTSTGNTPLLAAAAIGDADMTELLLSQRAQVDVANASGYHPIHMAAHKNRVDVLRLLIGAGSPVDSATKQNETPLSIAVDFGYAEVVQHVILAGVDLDLPPPGRDRVIFSALKARDVNVCLKLVQGGADLTSPSDDSNTVTPVHLAAELGLDSVLAAMIHNDVDLETSTWQGYTPLYSAAENGHLSTVRLLLKNGASIRTRSTSGGNLLFVSTGHSPVIKHLVDLCIDVNERDHYGASALHYAALRGHTAGAKALLQRGAGLKHANSVFETMADFREGTPYRQGTPAGLAKQKGHIQLARMIDRWKVKS